MGTRVHGFLQSWCTGLVPPQYVGSSRTSDQIGVPWIARQILNHWAIRKAPNSLFPNREMGLYFSSVVAQSCLTLCDPMNHSTPGLPIHHQLPESTQPMSIESVTPSSHFILCHPLLFPPSIFLSIKEFYNESALRIRWPKYWSFSFNISSSNEYSRLISVRIN